jgi:hypothetical protein
MAMMLSVRRSKLITGKCDSKSSERVERRTRAKAIQAAKNSFSMSFSAFRTPQRQISANVTAICLGLWDTPLQNPWTGFRETSARITLLGDKSASAV